MAFAYWKDIDIVSCKRYSLFYSLVHPFNDAMSSV